jgi:hypothetical protein
MGLSGTYSTHMSREIQTASKGGDRLGGLNIDE